MKKGKQQTKEQSHNTNTKQYTCSSTKLKWVLVAKIWNGAVNQALHYHSKHSRVSFVY